MRLSPMGLCCKCGGGGEAGGRGSAALVAPSGPVATAGDTFPPMAAPKESATLSVRRRRLPKSSMPSACISCSVNDARASPSISAARNAAATSDPKPRAPDAQAATSPTVQRTNGKRASSPTESAGGTLRGAAAGSLRGWFPLRNMATTQRGLCWSNCARCATRHLNLDPALPITNTVARASGGNIDGASLWLRHAN